MNCWEEQPSRWLAPTVVAAGTGWKQAGTVHWVLAVAVRCPQDTAWGWQWKAGAPATAV